MTLWVKWLLVASGGAMGAVMRTALSEWIHGRFDQQFGWGTLTVNIVGCLAMGAARAGVDLADWGSPEMRTLAFAGVLGAFTTFSTFEADAAGLWRAGEQLAAFAYVAMSVLGGLAAFWIGWISVARAV